MDLLIGLSKIILGMLPMGFPPFKFNGGHVTNGVVAQVGMRQSLTFFHFRRAGIASAYVTVARGNVSTKST